MSENWLEDVIDDAAKKQQIENDNDRTNETILLLVRNLMEKLPGLSKLDLLKISYNGGKDLCPEWAIDKVLQERGEEIDKIERVEIQTDMQLRNRVLELILSKRRSQATELIVNRLKENHFFYTTKEDLKEEVWVYENGIYVPNGKTTIKEQVRLILGDAFNTHICNEIIEKIQADTYVLSNEFFRIRNKEEIVVENGALNIFTLDLSPLTPSKIFFNKLPVRYEPLASCDMIDTFLGDVLADKTDKMVFYEIGGFSLLKEYLFEKAFMFVGAGRNGKDKSLELLKRMVGVKNCSGLPLNALEPNNFAISELFNRHLNLAGEISNQDLKDTTLFKALTGRSIVTAKRKFLHSIEFVNFAKFVFACNELPLVYDDNKGFWDRWVLLTFPFCFVTREELEQANDEDRKTLKLRDEGIIEKITTPKEMSGLLNECLKGLRRLMENRRFSSTKGSEEIKMEWVRKANSFLAFCIDNVVEEYDGVILKRDMRKRYVNYCKEHKLRAKSDIVIKRTLQEIYGANEEKTMANFGTQEYVWSGVKWK
jgi:putative DNA primase/helicase